MARDRAVDQELLEVPIRDPRESLGLFEGRQNAATLTFTLLRPVSDGTQPWWWLGILAAGGGTAILFVAIVVTLVVGIGAWGNNIPVAWAFAITNFVFWIGFGHAGTLISAILVLLKEKWRASINRIAEAMTLCAIVQAGVFPLMHLGRPWKAYWLAWYPSTLRVWPQFKSSLPWDFVAVTAYFLVSLVFWYVGLLPDLAAARDHARTRAGKAFYAVLALGWTGAARQWHHWKIAYLLLAGLATALVISVESIVSFDFAVAQVPGWHATIFPPYFVASAMLSGFALLTLLLLPTRRLFGLHQVITAKHFDVLGKLVLAFSWMVFYGYVQENLLGWYGGDPFEMDTYALRRTGPFAPLWELQVWFTFVVPQFMWSRRVRTHSIASAAISAAVIVGVWIEQFMHIVPSLSRDFLVSSWHGYMPSWVDWALLLGTISFFLFLFLLFLRMVPPIPISDVKKTRRDLLLEQEG